VRAQLINAALDISALFDARTDVVARMTRFTSRAPPGALLPRIEQAAQALGGTARRRGDARHAPARPPVLRRLRGAQQPAAAARARPRVTRRGARRRVRVLVPGAHGSVLLGVEVLPVVAGVHMVDVQRISGDRLDFYDAYAQLVARLEPLISGHKLPRLPSSSLSRVSGGPSAAAPAAPALAAV